MNDQHAAVRGPARGNRVALSNVDEPRLDELMARLRAEHGPASLAQHGREVAGVLRVETLIAQAKAGVRVPNPWQLWDGATEQARSCMV